MRRAINRKERALFAVKDEEKRERMEKELEELRFEAEVQKHLNIYA